MFLFSRVSFKKKIIFGVFLIIVLFLLNALLTYKEDTISTPFFPTPTRVSVINLTPKPGSFTKPFIPTYDVLYEQTSVEISSKINIANLPKTLKVFAINKKETDTQDKKAKEISLSLGIKDDYGGVLTETKLQRETINGKQVYFWFDNNNNKTMSYILGTGTFSYSESSAKVPSQQTSATNIEAVLTFLKQHNLTPSKHEIRTQDNSVFVIPFIENIPIITARNNGNSIAFDVNNDLSFSRIDYFYSPPRNGIAYPLTDPEAVFVSLKNLVYKPVFIDVTFGVGESGSKPTISEIVINSVSVKYYLYPNIQNTQDFSIQPVYVVNGTWEDRKGFTGKITFIVPAVREEYFK